MKKVNGIILAGGKSQRMGSDKALLTLGPYTFLEKVYQALQDLCQEVIVVGPAREIQNLNVTYIEDIFPNKGPMGGIYSGLVHSDVDLNLVVSCDGPLVDTEMLAHLLKQENPNITIYRGSKTWPFPGVYHKELIPKLEESLKKEKLKTTEWIGQHEPLYLNPSQDQMEKLININTPQDYKNLFENEIDN